jgi:diguanylate cyclase (GGDEF)-like protein/PAS domain S-box-containing protein
MNQEPCMKWSLRFTSFSAMALLFGGACLAVSVVLYFVTARLVEEGARKQFEYENSKAQLAIEARIRDYVDVVVGLKALFRTSDRISRLQFQRYLQGLQLAQRFPGIQNFNYAAFVPAHGKDAFEEAVRRDASIDPRGYPDFAIKPSGLREAYYPLIYSEPMQRNSAWFGVDIATNSPLVAKALALSRDTGELISSGRLIPVVDGEARVALAMRMPLYRVGMPLNSVAERRAAYFGSVGVGFDLQRLMVGTLDGATLNRMRYRLYDFGPEGGHAASPKERADRLLFDSQAESRNEPVETEDTFTSMRSMHIAGRVWETHCSARQTMMMSEFGRLLPSIILALSLLSSLLLFTIFYALATSRRRAVRLAAVMTKDLRESEASLEDAQQMTHMGSWRYDFTGVVMTWSTETYRIFGRDPCRDQVRYDEFLAQLHEADRGAVREGLEQALGSGREFSAEHRILRCDGSTRWVQTIALRDADARKSLLRGTIMDITVRKLTELQTHVEHRVTQLVASADDVGHVIPKVIEALCTGLGWTCGMYWVRSGPGAKLHCAQHWGIDSPEAHALIEARAQLRIDIGDDLPGRAWEAPDPMIVRGLCAERGDPPGPAHGADGRYGIAMSVRSNERVFGVIECVATELGVDEGRLRQLLRVVSSHVLQFLQRKAAEEALIYVAAHDTLTGLPNRSMFNQALRHALARDLRYGVGVAVMFIDLDRFKLVNDTLGHTAGDRLLQECGRRLTDCLRNSDLIARFGGDEFAVLVEQFDQQADIAAIAKKILCALKQPFMLDGHEFRVSASIGISMSPEDGTDIETLLSNADAAMYRAKGEGKGFDFYSQQINKHLLARFELETALRHAIEGKQLLLHYQPKIDARTGSIVGLEALLRWDHPQLGFVSPTQFIPVAEESALIIEIGHWALKEACRQAYLWQQQGLAPIRMAVNLSARQFKHPDLVQDIAQILAETRLAPSRLELEITESMVMERPDQAIAVLEQLKAMGIHLSIDDFGTGYSSLAYLRKLPVDCVKIDRAFVKDIPTEADDMAISKSIIALGHSLRLTVVAEGVETREQLLFLRAHGCDEIQGYLCSKPMPAAGIGLLLKRSPAEQLWHAYFHPDAAKPSSSEEQRTYCVLPT